MRLALILCLWVVTAARTHGGVVEIGVEGIGFDLGGGSIEGIFDAASPDFTSEAVGRSHQALNDAGIVTDGWVTIFLVETDHGTSLVTLVDQETAGSLEMFAELIMGSTAPLGAEPFIHNAMGTHEFFETPVSVTASVQFLWDAEGGGAAFAWAGLLEGDAITTIFSTDTDDPAADLGLQFVSFDGGQWSVAHDSQIGGTTSYTATIVPTPPTLGLALCLLARRRRRNR